MVKNTDDSFESSNGHFSAIQGGSSVSCICVSNILLIITVITYLWSGPPAKLSKAATLKRSS